MRAAVLHSPGDIRLETVPEPKVSADNVILKVAACSVCGSDIPRMLSKGAQRMPLICGHEFSGHIVDIGRDVTGFRVGDLVAVPPLIACYRCSQCLTRPIWAATGSLTLRSTVMTGIPAAFAAASDGATASAFTGLMIRTSTFLVIRS
jgi:threonine dehydrogenase-like Zn-dependent dehydrogenase